MHRRLAVVVTLLLLAAPASGYPLDGYQYTGITRLVHQRAIQENQIKGKKRPAGELLPMDQVRLRLADRPDFQVPAADPKLTATVKRLIGPNVSRYGISLLDLSDMANPTLAEYNGNQRQNPGSVGKILVALAIFQALADIYPDDIPARENVLRTAMITADEFSEYDHHTVRHFNPETGQLIRRKINKGDTASMWTYLDWMMSPSSNSAAGMLQKHLMLLVHYGKSYPVTPEEEARFFKETSRQELMALFEKAMQTPVTRNGLDLETLRQGSFFTRKGKNKVPGTSRLRGVA